jgi:hypothetical protein
VIERDAAAAGTTGFRLVPTVGQQLTPVPTTHRSHTKRSPPRQKRPKTYGKTKPGGPAAALLLHVADPAAAARPEGRSSRTALRDLTILGAVTLDARDNRHAGPQRPRQRRRGDILATLVRQMPGAADALDALVESPAAAPRRRSDSATVTWGAMECREHRCEWEVHAVVGAPLRDRNAT